MTIKLRAYQEDDVAAIQAALESYRRVLYVLPTGGGKTMVFTHIVALLAGCILVLAHRAEIADQISAALTLAGVAHGRIQPGHPKSQALVQVGMVQTVARRLCSIKEQPALIVIDEAHHAVAGMWAKVAAAWPCAKVLGVTATPERLDGKGLRDAFDVMVVGPSGAELTAAGHLAPFRYLAPRTQIDISAVRTTAGDYNSKDLEWAVDRAAITGDVIAHYLEHVAPRTAIAFCVTVAHAEHVATMFRDHGIPAASIDGSMRPDQRREVVNKLRDGDIRVLTSCEVISEGFDAPAVGGCILLRPTQSFALYRQQIGRCLRPKGDGSMAVIVDHVGNVFRHALPDAPHVWSLDSQKRTQRQRDAAASGIRRCRACEEVFPKTATAADCAIPGDDECLFKPHFLPTVAGELVELQRTEQPRSTLTPEWARGLNIKTAGGWQWYQLLQHAGEDRERLRQIQEARGYKIGWIYHQAQDAAAKRAARA
jgi:superfamily II DNA or RNA helicase